MKILAAVALATAISFACPVRASQYTTGGVSSQGTVIESQPGMPVGTPGNPITINGAVVTPTPSSLAAFQVKIVTTGTAVQLPATLLVNGMSCLPDSGNAAPITFGGSSVTTTANGTGNGDIRKPGVGWSMALSNANAVWINGNTGDFISCSGN